MLYVFLCVLTAFSAIQKHLVVSTEGVKMRKKGFTVSFFFTPQDVNITPKNASSAVYIWRERKKRCSKSVIISVLIGQPIIGI